MTEFKGGSEFLGRDEDGFYRGEYAGHTTYICIPSSSPVSKLATEFKTIQFSNFKGKYATWGSSEVLLNDYRDIKRWKVCRFRWTNRTGDYDPATGRYDGAIGMLADGLADLYFK